LHVGCIITVGPQSNGPPTSFLAIQVCWQGANAIAGCFKGDTSTCGKAQFHFIFCHTPHTFYITMGRAKTCAYSGIETREAIKWSSNCTFWKTGCGERIATAIFSCFKESAIIDAIHPQRLVNTSKLAIKAITSTTITDCDTFAIIRRTTACSNIAEVGIVSCPFTAV